ncbi:MAG: hypothetical protein P4L51_07555 [Puia sp.]|nr:hypothetical protein [Puia sp.]
MNGIKKIQYDCKQATYLIEKKQIVRLTFYEKIRLWIHLAGCSVCRIFQRQSILITRMAKEFFQNPPSPRPGLDDTFKKELQDRIEERLKKD